MEDVLKFVSINWVNMLLVVVGSFALVIYLLQERKRKIEAASLIVLQIDELQERVKEISTYITNGQLDEISFYESLPLMEENYWDKYKHYFVRKMDATSYVALNHLYDYVSEIQEQQLLLKSLQKKGFYATQSVWSDIEKQFIIEGLSNAQEGVAPQSVASVLTEAIPASITEKDKKTLSSFLEQMASQNQNFDTNQFWNIYRKQQGELRTVLNQNALTKYIPIQIATSLEKMLKKYSMLGTALNNGYHVLQKISKKKF